MGYEIFLDDAYGMKTVKTKLNSNPPWVFVGSSISIFSPSSIPNGGRISSTLANELLISNTEYVCEEHLDIVRKLLGEILFEHLFELSPNINKAKTILNKFFRIPKANALHELLITALNSGLISGIITTNYDLCFEKATNFDKNKIKVIVSENDAICYSHEDLIIFKIHGTCNDYEGVDLHCTLKDEGSMPEWKIKFLKKILHHSSILFTGYSGFDFEICKEIQQFDNIELVLWNDLKPYKELSNNARGIIDKFDGITLVGDMTKLISYVCNTPLCILKYSDGEIDLRLKELARHFSDALNDGEIINWFLNTLTSCGLARASIYAATMAFSCNTHKKITRAVYREHLAASKYKMGLYRTSLYNQILAAYSYRTNCYDYIRNLIDATETCKAGFRLISSLILLRYCSNLIQKNETVFQTKELNFLCNRFNNRKNEIGARISSLKLGKITQLILNFIRFNKIEEIQTSSAKGGDWILNFNDKVTHARGLASSTEYEEVSERMKEMGLMFEYFYDFRRFLEKKCSDDGNDVIIKGYKEIINNMLSDEELCGIYPEVWKLKRFYNKIDPHSFTRDWQKCFWKCQYSFYGRVLLLLGKIHV